MFKILYQDAWCVAIHKPAGFFVHPPEESYTNPSRVARKWVCLNLLRKQLGQPVFPVHRLDRATSGVLLFALSGAIASALCSQFLRKSVRKTYWAIVRGHVMTDGLINRPLLPVEKKQRPKTTAPADAVTRFSPLARIELQSPVGRYATARYTWLEVWPETGRHHQIRRHLRAIGHPILGDSMYGDLKHNRFFKNHLEIPGLLLRAVRLDLEHPISGAPWSIMSRTAKSWNRIQDLFGFCPLLTPLRAEPNATNDFCTITTHKPNASQTL